MTRRNLFASIFAAPPPTGMTYRPNLKGEPVSILGYGAMRYPTVDGRHANSYQGGSSAPIDLKAVQHQIDYAIAHGMNYFDTSPAYCRGESEGVLGQCLAHHPRTKWRVATKMSNFSPAQQSTEASKKLFATSLKLLKVDYFDYYLLHACGMGGWSAFENRFLKNGILDWLLEQRAKGVIRNLGFSYHGDVKVFNWLMERSNVYKWDFVQIQMNYVDWLHAKEVNKRNMNAEWLYNEIAVKRGIPVVVMEPLLGGRLARFNLAAAQRLVPFDPAATPASWAFRFVGSHPKVLTMLSGMTYMEHMEENIRTVSPLKLLSPAEFAALEECAKLYLADEPVPCTACQYCMPCPYGLDIPSLLAFWNDQRNARDLLAKYDREFPKLRRADHCIGCVRCLPHCPQSIDIPRTIHRLDEMVEDLRRA